LDFTGIPTQLMIDTDEYQLLLKEIFNYIQDMNYFQPMDMQGKEEINKL